MSINMDYMIKMASSEAYAPPDAIHSRNEESMYGWYLFAQIPLKGNYVPLFGSISNISSSKGTLILYSPSKW
ncbi:hypothetical protein BC351_37520 [Paenibacillus ferrarius]|uniref:Uncharacterized protein n=1 Tax=Paenibacillus ferrarius TaxID=1469647 RepID=A0A1V4HBW8_9BACL|nr:hypothetical protein BC351_37520 [Paenibacillus ferrarius]